MDALCHHDFVQPEKLRQNIHGHACRVRFAALVLDALQNGGVDREGGEYVCAQHHLVRLAKPGQEHPGSQLVEEGHGVAVLVVKLIKLVRSCGAGVDALVDMGPAVRVEILSRPDAVEVDVHLLGHPTHLAPARVDDGGGVRPLEVQRADLVYARDYLVYGAVIEFIPLAVDTRCDMAEFRLAAHVVPRQIALVKLVIVRRGSRHGDDGEYLSRHESRHVLEVGQADVRQIKVRLKHPFLDAGRQFLCSECHCLFPPLPFL